MYCGWLWWAGNVISEDVADGWGTDSGTTEAVQERQLVDWVWGAMVGWGAVGGRVRRVNMRGGRYWGVIGGGA